MEDVYKQALLELTEAVENLEPVLERVKQLKKTLTQDDYIKMLEEKNRELKERLDRLDHHDSCVVTSKTWSDYDVTDCSFSWNSLVIFFICVWLFLTFLGI